MIKKLLDSKSTSIMSAAVVIAVAGLISKLLGIVRDRVLAGKFGAGDALDIYFVSFRIPDLIYSLIVLGALSAGFIPVLAQLLKNEDKKDYNGNAEAWNLVNNVVNIVGLFLILISAALIIFSPRLVPLIAPGFSGEKLDLTIALTRVMFLSPLFLGISGILSGVLQTFRRFFIYSLAPILYNLGIIFGALFLTERLGVYGLGIGVVFGAFMHMLIQLPIVVNLGYRFKLIFRLKDRNFLRIMKLTGPRILGLASAQLNLIVTTILASTLAAGSLAIFNFANNLQSFPLGLFGVSFAVAAFPTLSIAFAKNDEDNFRTQFLKTFKQILFFTIPFSIILIILRMQVVRVILGAGVFDWEDTVLTGNSLGLFCTSLFAQALIPLLARAFYSRQNTLVPFIASFAGVIVNLIASWFFIKKIGMLGLAVGFSLSSIVNFVLLAVALKIKISNIFKNSLLKSLAKISCASLIMGVTVQYVKTWSGAIVDMNRFWGVFLQAFLAVLVGMAVFIFVGYLLKSEELLSFIASIRRKLFKQVKVEHESIDVV